jgi:hypothetical protein
LSTLAYDRRALNVTLAEEDDVAAGGMDLPVDQNREPET